MILLFRFGLPQLIIAENGLQLLSRVSSYQSQSAGVPADGQAEQDDLHDGQREDEQHHADVPPHPEEVLLDQRFYFSPRCELQEILIIY